MPRVVVALAAAVAVFTMACGGSSSSGTPTVTSGAFDSARAMADVQRLAGEIGPRVAGSDASKQAADYIAAELKRWGYGIVRQVVTYEKNPNREASITLGASTVDATTLAGSKTETVTGAAAWVGDGDAAAVVGQSLQGKVAVAQRGGASFTDIYLAVKAAGASALVVVNDADEPLTGKLSAPAAIAVVGVPGSAEQALRAAANTGGELIVTVPPADVVATENVVARPSNGDSCVVVVGANYDTVGGTPGANDNASGIATVLEIARDMALPKQSPAACFVAFGAKVDGSKGSGTFITNLPQTPTPTAMVNLYGLGEGSSLVFYGDGRTATTAAGTAADAGINGSLAGGQPSYATDAGPFRAAGIPALDVTLDRFSTRLDAGDTPDKIDSETFAKAGAAMLAFVQTLARNGGP